MKILFSELAKLELDDARNGDGFIFVAGRKMVRAAQPTANHSFFGQFNRQMVARWTHAKTGIDVFSVPRFL